MKNEKLNAVLYGVLGLVVFLAVWQLLVMFTNVGLLFPSPIQVFQRLVASTQGLIGKHPLIVHLGFSLLRVGIGYLISAVLGILLPTF